MVRGYGGAVTISLPRSVASTLEEGRQAYVAVPSKHGPHVTPELYTWSDGALWFASAASTLKTKVLARDPWAGAAVSTADRSVVLRGPVESFDLRRPDRLAKRLRQWPSAAEALGRFGVRNASDLLAFARDTVTGRLGWRLPDPRVLFRLEPSAVVEITGGTVVGGWGGWTDARGTAPDEPDAQPAGGVPAVVAVPGPVPVPCRWFEDEGKVRLPAGMLSLLELADEVDVGVVTDEYMAPGPAAKQGRLLRGIARVDDEEPDALRVRAARVVEWDGAETSASPASG